MLPEAGELSATTTRVELLRRVAAAQVDLTPAEARVAALVLAEPSSVLSQSLMQVAARAGVSEPTVIRLRRVEEPLRGERPLLPLDRSRWLPELPPAPGAEHRERCPLPADRGESR
jgi:DNA-binding CsgD family transcriptional regulator